MHRLRVSVVTIAFLAIPTADLGGADVRGDQIAVAVSSTAPAFAEAVSTFRTSLGSHGSLVVIVPLDNRELARNNAKERPRIAVAFGSRAAEAFATSDPGVPLVVSMVLANDFSGTIKPQQLVATLTLSLDHASILAKLKSTFPTRKKLAVLVSSDSGKLRNDLNSLALRLGYELEVIECSNLRDVLAAFATLRGRVDFVWCLPDSDLFPSVAIPAILLTSIRNELPIIGFSEGFVRAGAAVGFYPDYADIGVQTAETVRRYLAKQDILREQEPRKVRMAVNDRVLRILGVERPKLSNEVLVIR